MKKLFIVGLIVLSLFLVACARQGDESAFAGQASGPKYQKQNELIDIQKYSSNKPIVKSLDNLNVVIQKEICDNNVDDNNDGKIDCSDSLCNGFISLDNKNRDAICADGKRQICGSVLTPYGSVVNAGGFDALCFQNGVYSTWEECNTDGIVEKKGSNGLTVSSGKVEFSTQKDYINYICAPYSKDKSNYESWIGCGKKLGLGGVQAEKGDAYVDRVCYTDTLNDGYYYGQWISVDSFKQKASDDQTLKMFQNKKKVNCISEQLCSEIPDNNFCDLRCEYKAKYAQNNFDITDPLVVHYGDKIVLKSNGQGKYLSDYWDNDCGPFGNRCKVSGDIILANKPSTYERFTILPPNDAPSKNPIYYGDRITLRSNLIITFESSGTVNSQPFIGVYNYDLSTGSQKVTSSQIFYPLSTNGLNSNTLSDLKDKPTTALLKYGQTITLYSVGSQMYVSAEDNGNVVANRPGIGSWEQFTIEKAN